MKSIKEPTEILCINQGLENTDLSLWHLQKEAKYKSPRKRRITEDWLMREVDEMNLNFGYWITLSFYSQVDDPVIQYIDNKHIRKVILDFLYPNKKPKNRIRLWFFVEQHKSKKLHLHFLMEQVDYEWWLGSRNRKIILHKNTLSKIISNQHSIDEVFTEALTNHLKERVNKLGKGKKSTKVLPALEMDKRVHYVNKSLNNWNFDKWQHIDFASSDFREQTKNQMENKTQCISQLESVI